MWPVLLIKDNPQSSSLQAPRSIDLRNVSQVSPELSPSPGMAINHPATKAWLSVPFISGHFMLPSRLLIKTLG